LQFFIGKKHFFHDYSKQLFGYQKKKVRQNNLVMFFFSEIAVSF